MSGASSSPCETPQTGDLIFALDFGTSRTGLSYTVVDPGREDVMAVPLCTGQTHCEKTFTSVVISKQNLGGLYFGETAEEEYAKQGCEREDWLLFSKFKMVLHDAFEEDPILEAQGGRGTLHLSTVLKECFSLIRNRVEDFLREESDGALTTRSLFWVITVPAIWTDFAKSVMRKAACEARMIDTLESARLILALEPECAAIDSQINTEACWEVGTKFQIVDCGAGTLDITSHCLVDTCPLVLREIAAPSGCAVGSKMVDDNFFGFFNSLIGDEKFTILMRDFPHEYLTLARGWERIKVNHKFVGSDGPGAGTQKLVLTDILPKLGIVHAELKESVNAWNSSHRSLNVSLSKDPTFFLKLSPDLMRSFFQETAENIVKHVCQESNKDLGLDHIVLAGGFSNCPLLVSLLKEEFRGQQTSIEVANNPEMSIVRGAALYGSRAGQPVGSRKSKKTFGIVSRIKFQPGNSTHEKNRNKAIRGPDGCLYIDHFDVHVKAGSDLYNLGSQLEAYGPASQGQQHGDVRILASECSDVFCVNDEEVQELGSAMIPFSSISSGQQRKVYVKFCFGGPEIRCHILDAQLQNERVIRIETTF